MSRILVLDGHPRRESFGAALADGHAAGTAAAGAHVARLTPRDLVSDPVLHEGYAIPRPLEADLVHAPKLLRGTEHLAVLYPSSWGDSPALLKGFLDRTLLPGFAFRFREDSRWDNLLTGRSARILVTMDWPLWAWSLLLGAPGRRAMKGATLEFWGFDPVRVTELGRSGGPRPPPSRND